MARIARVRAVLLSAPYEDPATNAEALLHLPSGWRTTGLVEIADDDGAAGLGEGYLAVFAPDVFRAIVALVAPVLAGRDADDPRLVRDVEVATGYWSRQGAARHVVGAVETAILDLRAQRAGLPVHALLGAERNHLTLYGSGGDALRPEPMRADIAACARLGIGLWKIRAQVGDPLKMAWCLGEAARAGVETGVDMVQSLAQPAQEPVAVARFLAETAERAGRLPAFVEDPVGADAHDDWRALREAIEPPVAGGEIVTTPAELDWRVAAGLYDWVQPDASVLGGVAATVGVVTRALARGCRPVVHAWGGPVGMMANYHAALAGGGEMVEWPLTHYPLRDAMVARPWDITGGTLTLPDLPGLGVRLTPEVERDFAFREDAVYACLADRTRLPGDEVWAA